MAGVATAEELTVNVPDADAARAGLKDYRGGAVARPLPGCRVQVFCVMLNGVGAAKRDRADGVARGVGDGDRLRGAGLARADHGKRELRRVRGQAGGKLS